MSDKIVQNKKKKKLNQNRHYNGTWRNIQFYLWESLTKTKCSEGRQLDELVRAGYVYDLAK